LAQYAVVPSIASTPGMLSALTEVATTIGAHCPLLQVEPAPHARPQVPQLVALVCSLTHAPLQAVGVAVGQTQLLHVQLAEHVSVPEVSQVCVASGAHTPAPVQVFACQAPLVEQVSVSVPQLPQAIGFVCPGAQTPAHLPVEALHVELVQAAAAVCPPFTHDQGVLLLALHPTWLGAHVPPHAPAEHVLLAVVQDV
jgi:hypothetical protein